MMRAISLWQPWATLMAVEAKRWETRGRKTYIRGEVAICAAKRWQAEQIEFTHTPDCEHALWKAGVIDYKTKFAETEMPFGAVVSVGELTACITTGEWMRLHVSRTMSKELQDELTFGNYDVGRFAWKFERMRKLTPPVPVKASQGFFFLTPEVETAVRARL